MSDRKTKFAYEVVIFTTPNYDRDLIVKVNENVNRVRAWAEHLGPVREPLTIWRPRQSSHAAAQKATTSS